MKSLRKIFDSPLIATAEVQSTHTVLNRWLFAVDKSRPAEKFRAWVHEYCILPKILWPLLIYIKFKLSSGRASSKKSSSSFTGCSVYEGTYAALPFNGHTNKLQLPFTDPTRGIYQIQRGATCVYRDSTDCRVSSARVTRETVREWQVEEAVEQAEARPRHVILITLCGSWTSKFW